MNQSRPAYAGVSSNYVVPEQERLCSLGRHEQPLVEGRCEYCGDYDTED